VKMVRTLELIRKYEECEMCGSIYLGNGEGTLEVTDDTFTRTCKCGWKVEVTDKVAVGD
jgi:hypothetical protein